MIYHDLSILILLWGCVTGYIFYRWGGLQPLLLAYNRILHDFADFKSFQGYLFLHGLWLQDDITLLVQNMCFIHLHSSFASNAAALQDKTSGFPFSLYAPKCLGELKGFLLVYSHRLQPLFGGAMWWPCSAGSQPPGAQNWA